MTSQSTYRLERKLAYCFAKGLPLFIFCQIRNLKHFLNIGGKMGMFICCGNAKKQTFKTQEIPVVWNRQLDDANTATGGY